MNNQSQNILLILLLVLFNCSEKPKQTKLTEGHYKGVLEVKDNEQLPFNFEVTSDETLKIYNAEEVIEVDEITYKNDSVYIKTPIFQVYITAKIDSNNNLTGFYKNDELKRKVPFSAYYNVKNRFDTKAQHNVDVSGVWETIFSPNTASDSYIAKGIFEQNGQNITGTFRTTTGDYRFLEGVVEGDSLKLSTFDGAHAFLFTAKLTDSTMNGHFYSGNHWKEPFIAKLNIEYELPDANSLTHLKEGYDKFEFEFPDTDGNLISLDDEQFRNKVVVVQLMGTWCPNCLDESKYYKAYLEQNKDKEIAFIALAFEYAKTKERAIENIKRLKDGVGLDYPILLAQFGTSNKSKAQEKLPMLNHVLSYPTSIFIDKKGEVRKIHTGFNGPSTGEKYDEFKKEFESFMEILINE